MNHFCHLCARPNPEPLIDFGSHPIAHQLLMNPTQAEYTHPVILGFCEGCGLAQLIDPIPAEKLYTNYHFLSSWKWNPHVPRLLKMIEDLSDVKKDSTILEVGSNDGSFLADLVKRGYSNVHGLEPAGDAVAAAEQRGVKTRRGYFTPRVAQELAATIGPCDLLISRQVLEHVTNLQEFATAMRAILRPGAHVLVEVPNFGFNLQAPDYSAIWEEHVNHFTLATLSRFLLDTGIEVLQSETAVFSGDILIALGRYSDTHAKTTTPLTETRRKTLAYRDHWPNFRKALVDYLTEQKITFGKIAVYGAGCRSCCLINYAGLGAQLEFVVDDQPEKHGKFMPGSRLPILPSHALTRHGIAVCLLAVNAENEDKVIGNHKHFLERDGRFVSVHPPSSRLPAFWKPI